MRTTPPRYTVEQFDIALAKIASVIETHPRGENAWPIFDRLEQERAKLIGRADRLQAALDRRRKTPDT